jgi:hypothetical protein
MQPQQIFVLAVLLFAVFLAWSLSRGHTVGVPLYVLSIVIAAALLAGSIAQLLNVDTVVEALNVTAIALALAALPAHPTLWQEQMEADLRRIRLVQPLRAGDLLSWRGWLKLVDRIGARRAAFVYFSMFAIAIGAALVATSAVHSADRTIYTTLAALAPALFAVLSTMWIYRGARRLVPGA